MMGFRRYSIELYRRLGAFETVGSLRLASSPEQLRELERTASRARGIGLDAGRHRRGRGAPPDAGDLAGFAVRRGPSRRRRPPRPARRDPRGGRRRAGAGRPDPDRGPRHRVRAVRPARDHGRPDRDRPDRHRARRQRRRHLGAAGRGDGRRASSRRPRSTTSTSRSRPCPARSSRATCRASATRTTSCTARASTAGWSSAATSSIPVSRWEDGVPWDHAARSLPPDYERFEPLMHGAIRRFPFLADAEAIRLVCHPDAMTPDANPLLGPLPGVRGFWVAAGLSLNGFGGGGGIGRAMAGWITAGDPGVDIGPYRAWRFSDTYRDPGFAAGSGARDVLATTTGCATRSTRTCRVARGGCRRSTDGSRRRARSSGRRPAGNAPTTTTRPAAGVAPGAIRPATAGPGRRGSSGLRGGPCRPRACRDGRSVVVRQDRGRGARRARAPPARQRE